MNRTEKVEGEMGPEKVNVGLGLEQRCGVVRLLNRTLANESILLIKTKKCHWDIVGNQFLTLHQLFDEQHAEISRHVDETAERIRTLGGYPASTAQEFVSFAKVKEHPGTVLGAAHAVQELLADHEMIARSLREFVNQTSETLRDAGTADFFTQLLRSHEKAAWMLRSMLPGDGPRSSGKAPQGGVT